MVAAPARPTFTAQEVQMAYTLMAIEYMKSIRGMSPNYAAVDRAQRLKQLGFVNSKDVTNVVDDEKQIEVLKCYSFLQQHFPGSIILSESDFVELNLKYGLICGRLDAYKGSIPDVNVEEILKVQATLQSLGENPYTNISKLDYKRVELITNLEVQTVRTREHIYGSRSPIWYERPSQNGIVWLDKNKVKVNAFPFRHFLMEELICNDVFVHHMEAVRYSDLFVAAPASDMTERLEFSIPESRRIPLNDDPFVFQITPIGVVIHSKWGVEAEDDIFENIKPL